MPLKEDTNTPRNLEGYFLNKQELKNLIIQTEDNELKSWMKQKGSSNTNTKSIVLILNIEMDLGENLGMAFNYLFIHILTKGKRNSMMILSGNTIFLLLEIMVSY